VETSDCFYYRSFDFYLVLVSTTAFNAWLSSILGNDGFGIGSCTATVTLTSAFGCFFWRVIGAINFGFMVGIEIYLGFKSSKIDSSVGFGLGLEILITSSINYAF